MDQYELDCCHCQSTYKVCRSTYYGAKRDERLFGHKHHCSIDCRLSARGREPARSVVCMNCSKEFKKRACDVKRYTNSFCSHSCSATYNNKNKTHGTRRSKLEAYLEEELKSKYINLEFHFNSKDAINSELDIYIPSMKLAFEMNGIFHYEPIYGEQKLKQIQNNDTRKFQACLEKGIELCLIDSSSLSYFKPANAKKYLDIVCELIDSKLVARRELNPR